MKRDEVPRGIMGQRNRNTTASQKVHSQCGAKYKDYTPTALYNNRLNNAIIWAGNDVRRPMISSARARTDIFSLYGKLRKMKKMTMR